MGIVDKLIAKYELYQLEKRYTRREKRTTFTSGARYVDGEYVYDDHSTGSYSPKSTSSTWSNRRMPSVRVTEYYDGGRRSRAY